MGRASVGVEGDVRLVKRLHVDLMHIASDGCRG
jgi:hypothetical protein